LASQGEAVAPAALDHALGISFDAYTAQVMGFLDPQQKEIFDQRASWNAMQNAVVEQPESLQ
jgi:hypothetical protein